MRRCQCPEGNASPSFVHTNISRGVKHFYGNIEKGPADSYCWMELQRPVGEGVTSIGGRTRCSRKKRGTGYPNQGWALIAKRVSKINIYIYIYVHENLAKRRQELVNKTRQSSAVLRVWTNDGRIKALLKSNKKVKINSEKDIEKLE